MEKLIRRLVRLFGRPSPAEMAAKELAEAELQRLSAHTGMEYAAAMVEYHTKRIERLKAFLHQT